MKSYLLQFPEEDDFLNRLKVSAARNNESMKDFMVMAVEDRIKKLETERLKPGEPVPNIYRRKK